MDRTAVTQNRVAVFKYPHRSGFHLRNKQGRQRKRNVVKTRLMRDYSNYNRAINTMKTLIDRQPSID